MALDFGKETVGHAKEGGLLEYQFKEVMKKQGVDTAYFDPHEIDSSLTFHENWKALEKRYGVKSETKKYGEWRAAEKEHKATTTPIIKVAPVSKPKTYKPIHGAGWFRHIRRHRDAALRTHRRKADRILKKYHLPTKYKRDSGMSHVDLDRDQSIKAKHVRKPWQPTWMGDVKGKRV